MDAEAAVRVKEFIEVFEAPQDPEFWKGLVEEELSEAEEAFMHFMKELADLRYTIEGYYLTAPAGSRYSTPFLNARMDRINRILSTLNGLDGFKGGQSGAFYLVHQSNMSKLDDNGKPIRREDGKILKGPNYQPPDLRVILEML